MLEEQRKNVLEFAKNLAATASKLWLQNHSFEISTGLYMAYRPSFLTKLKSRASVSQVRS